MAKTGPKPIDISNQTFGRLTAKSYVGDGKWLCDCACGKSKIVSGPDIKRGKVKSCGCIHMELLKKGVKPIQHGMAGSPEYRTWTSMIRRCKDPDCPGYHRYGGRGITVCDRWLNSFLRFYEDMGHRPRGTTLDRIDFNGHYEPSNCRWADKITQAANTSTAVLITANGKTQTVAAWSRELRISTSALFYRKDRGWSDDKIINTPFRKHTRW